MMGLRCYWLVGLVGWLFGWLLYFGATRRRTSSYCNVVMYFSAFTFLDDETTKKTETTQNEQNDGKNK